MQDETIQDVKRAQRTFMVLWITVTAVKILIAARLPLFVDEAFYWQEGQHLAAAYSDLPGLTAWLTRLGTAIGGLTSGVIYTSLYGYFDRAGSPEWIWYVMGAHMLAAVVVFWLFVRVAGEFVERTE